MKHLLLSFLFLVIFATGFGQLKIVQVAPDEGINIGALNAAIEADTSSAIYELQPGGIYYINGRISTSYPLHIRAAAGEGPMPVLQPAVDENFESDRIFSLGGDTKLEGIYLTGLDDYGNLIKNIMRLEVEGMKLELTDCMVDYDAQCPMRINVKDAKVFLKNCIFRNFANPNSMGNGRVVDTRGNSTDTIWIENSTIYHLASEMVRIAGGFTKYLYFDHNTVFLNGSGIDFNVILNAKVTNNILYNMSFKGKYPEELDAFIEVDSIQTIETWSDADRQLILTHNNIYNESKFVDAMSNGTLVPDYYCDSSSMNFIASGQLDTSNNVHEALIFDNPPPAPMEYMIVYYTNDGELDAVEVPNFFADLDPSPSAPGGEDEYSFNYQGNLSLTASETGGPLGDPRWSATLVGIGDDLAKYNRGLRVYPNPADRQVTFTLDMGMERGNLEISIYDITGKEVQTYTGGMTQPGMNSVVVPVSELSRGVYVYKLKNNEVIVHSGKILIK